MNLFARLSTKTKELNQRRFGVSFSACSPDGVWYTNDAETGELLKTIQIVGNTIDTDVSTGDDVVVHTPNITISNRSLPRLPKAGERWLFKVATNPFPDAPLKDYMMSEDRIYTEDILGVTTIYLIEVEQS